MDNERDRIISLKEMFFYVLRHWVSIVIAAVLGGVLLGGLGFANYKSAKGYELTEEEKAYVNQLSDTYQKMAPISSTYSNSYIAKLDSENVYVSSLSYYVVADDLNDIELGERITNDITNAYLSYIGGKEFYSNIVSLTESIDIDELPFLIRAYASGNIILISIYANNESDLKIFSDSVKTTIDSQIDNINESIAPHSINLYKDYTYTGPDAMVVTIKNDYSALVDRMISNLAMSFKNMSNEQIKQFEDDNEGTLVELFNKDYRELGIPRYNPAAVKAPVGKLSIIKNAIVGIVLGCFVVCGCLCVNFLLSGKLMSPADVEEYYGTKLLGVVKADNSKSRLFYDAQYGVTANNTKANWEYISGNINNAISEDRVLLFSSSLEKKELTKILDKIKSYKNGDSIYVSEANINTIAGLNALNDAKSVVFVEQIGKCSGKDLDFEINKAKEYKVNIVGSVIIV